MRWTFKCGADDLEDGLTNNNESNRRNIQSSTDAEHREKESEKCEWPNDQECSEVDGLSPVPFDRPCESR